jgi:cytochrome c2
MPCSKKSAASILFALFLAFFAWNYFRNFNFSRGARMTGGDPEIGRTKLGQHSCVSCHIIPGVPNANGTLAPSLASWSKHRKLLDSYPNTPANLESWLQNPSRFKPGTTMPDLNVSPQDSRDMAAYLYSIN